MIRLGLALGVLAATAAACGDPGDPPRGLDVGGSRLGSRPATPSVTTTAGPEMTGTGMEGPPPYRLRFDGRELVLRPHTWCYRSGCVDGVVRRPPSVGDPAAVRVRVPVDGWGLVATFTPAGQPCGRRQSVQPVKDAGWYVLRPAGPAGSYDVELFAQGEGDMVAGFRWRTPTDGELPVPHARLALIADRDGRPDSYGVELMLENLARMPGSAEARITVVAANGRSLSFEATRAEQDCWPEGTVYFDGPDPRGEAAAALGGFPFHYAVTVTIDGRRYRASADFPRDEIAGNEPSVPLVFSPALPALRPVAAEPSG